MWHVRSRLMGCLAGGLVLAVSGWAAGQQTTTEVRRETRTTTTTTEVRRISTVIGSTVRLQEEDQYGKIEDIVLNDAGCVEYVVISHESGYVLVPWTVTTVNYEERVVAVDATPQQLETLVFTRDNWPSPSDPQFTRRVQQVFGSAAVRREGRGGAEIRGREDQGDRPGRPRATDRTTRDDNEAPDDRARDVAPRATGRPAPDDQPSGGEARPKATGRRPEPGDQPGAQESTPKATGRRPEPGDQPGAQESTPKATSRTAPGDRPGDQGSSTRPEPPRSEPRRP